MNIIRTLLKHHTLWHNGCYRIALTSGKILTKCTAAMLVVSHALTFTLRIFVATLNLSFTHSCFSFMASLFASRLRNLVCRPTGPLSFVFCKSHKNDYLYDNEVALLTSVYLLWISLKKVLSKMISMAFALATINLFKYMTIISPASLN